MLCVRSPGGHTMWAPGSVRQMGEAMRLNLRSGRHFRLGKRMSWLSDSILININEISFNQTNCLEPLLPICWPQLFFRDLSKCNP